MFALVILLLFGFGRNCRSVKDLGNQTPGFCCLFWRFSISLFVDKVVLCEFQIDFCWSFIVYDALPIICGWAIVVPNELNSRYPYVLRECPENVKNSSVDRNKSRNDKVFSAFSQLILCSIYHLNDILITLKNYSLRVKRGRLYNFAFDSHISHGQAHALSNFQLEMYL